MKMNTSAASTFAPATLDLDARVLSDQDLEEAAGGIVPLIALGLAAFKVGYDIGRDLAK